MKECEKETKEICKKVPIKEEINKDVEFCKGTPKKVNNVFLHHPISQYPLMPLNEAKNQLIQDSFL